MTPTNELRWVKRDIVFYEDHEGNSAGKEVSVLQQKWVGVESTTYNANGITKTKPEEWRDVPTVEEGEAK